MNIRRATVDDAEIIAEHRRLLVADLNWGDAQKREALKTEFIPYIRQALSEGKYLGWLAEIDGQVIAGAGLYIYDWLIHPDNPTGRRAYLMHVYTQPEYRRQGSARKIINLIIEWCRQEGFPTLFLHSRDPGQRLYKSMGFEPSNEMRLKL